MKAIEVILSAQEVEALSNSSVKRLPLGGRYKRPFVGLSLHFVGNSLYLYVHIVDYSK